MKRSVISSARLLPAMAFGLSVLYSGVVAQDFCNATHTGTPKTVTFNSVAAGSDKGETGPIGDYHYEQWIKSGSASAKFYPDGSFSCSFSNADDYLCREGVFYGKNSGKDPLSVGHLVADYSMSEFKNAGGISYAYVGVYGWMQDPLIEWYIVDNWGPASRPTWVGGDVDKTPFKTVTIDGAQYDLYRNSANRATIDGYKPFDQIYSVRKTAKKCGSIDIAAHFQAWKDAGITLGKSLYEAKILGEAGQYPENHGANGSIDFNYAKVYVVDGDLPIESSSSSKPASSSSITAGRTPYGGTAAKLPGTIEAEEYDEGGEGIAYGGADSEKPEYAMDMRAEELVDVVGTGKGYAVGNTLPGEWLEFTINVGTAGIYSIEASGATGVDSESSDVDVEIDGKSIATVAIPSMTGDDAWSTYTKVDGVKTASIPAGKHILRLTFTTGYVNLDYIKFTLLVAETEDDGNGIALHGFKVNVSREFQVFDMQGKYLGLIKVANEASISNAVASKVSKSGMYLVKQGNSFRKVLVKR